MDQKPFEGHPKGLKIAAPLRDLFATQKIAHGYHGLNGFKGIYFPLAGIHSDLFCFAKWITFRLLRLLAELTMVEILATGWLNVHKSWKQTQPDRVECE